MALGSYAGPKLFFVLDVETDQGRVRGHDFVGYVQNFCIAACGREICYRPDERFEATPENVMREVKENIGIGEKPILIYPDGREEPLVSLSAARNFIREARKDPFAYLCTPEEYYALRPLNAKAA